MTVRIESNRFILATEPPPTATQWRNVLGTERWAPIYFEVADGKLAATMTTCDCYRALTRVE